jgi:hypothetical protein
MDIASILLDRYPGQQWNLTNNDYDTLVWEIVNSVPKPTLEELENAWSTVLDTKKFKELREERNKRLAACDWVTLKAYSTDTPVPEEWKVYMQALRDLPANTEDPENPVWPTIPTA